MNKLFLLLIGNCIISSASYSQGASFPIEKVDSFITKSMNDWHTMGVAIGVIKKDSVILVKGYGYRDYANKLSVDGQTVFPIASCSKTFTAALFGIAEKEGRIQLDKPVNRHIPKFQLYNTQSTKQVTAEDLLSHRTGIAAHDWAWTFNTNFPEDVYLKRIKYMEPFASVGTKFQYNNFMYFVLSVLGEELYNKKWSSLIAEKLFLPLEMHASYSNFAMVKNHENIALTYEYEDSFQLQDTKQMDDLMGAASINSTADDLIRWMQMWINGGTYNNKQILTPQFVKKAIESNIVVYSGLSEQYPDEHFMNMGLSWFLSSYRGHYKAHHTGNIAGFSSSITFFPYDSLGIVVLTNQNGSALINLVPSFIADLFLNLPVRDKHSALISKQNENKLKQTPKSIDIDTLQVKPLFSLSKYTGRFQNPGYGPLKIETFKKGLLLTYYDLELVLLPKGKGHHFSSHYLDENKISLNGVGDVIFNFDKEGNIYSFRIPFEPAVKDIIFLKQ